MTDMTVTLQYQQDGERRYLNADKDKTVEAFNHFRSVRNYTNEKRYNKFSYLVRALRKHRDAAQKIPELWKWSSLTYDIDNDVWYEDLAQVSVPGKDHYWADWIFQVEKYPRLWSSFQALSELIQAHYDCRIEYAFKQTGIPLHNRNYVHLAIKLPGHKNGEWTHLTPRFYEDELRDEAFDVDAAFANIQNLLSAYKSQ